MTIDEEWEALAVILKLQGCSRSEVKNLFHDSSGPCWDLYVKEGINDTPHQTTLAMSRCLRAQDQRDDRLLEAMFGEKI